MQYNVTMGLSGPSADAIDSITAVYSGFPTMIGITIAVVLLFVGLAFRSVLVPIRAILTIAVTMLWIYGLQDLTYQHKIFSWMHWPGLEGSGTINWLPPIVCFSILVGISLDYDVFLLVRIKEFYDAGYPTSDSIVQGLYHTGHIITAAGLIMAIAFSGLLLSDIPGLNQLAFYLVFAVLFDTFISRSILVPAIMALLGDKNWWPIRTTLRYQLLTLQTTLQYYCVSKLGSIKFRKESRLEGEQGEDEGNASGHSGNGVRGFLHGLEAVVGLTGEVFTRVPHLRSGEVYQMPEAG